MTKTMDKVERLGRRRAWIAMTMGGLFLVTQLTRGVSDSPLRTVDYVGLAAWAVWGFVLLLFVVFGGGLWRGGPLRAMLNDENTEANRAAALRGGFWFMLVACGVTYANTFFEPVSARGALHNIITLSVAFAIFRFGVLEWRAHQELE
jgi:hypothetical protein